MRKYELTYLVSDEVPESDLNKVTGKVAGFIDELGGKVTKEDIWGRRKLAYPIKKQDFATYITLYFDLPADKAIPFEKDLRHIDGVLRQLMIVREINDEVITLTADEIADTADIQKVVGGERSFEAIKGETRESRDLMAKREETEKVKEEALEAVEETPVVEEKKETVKKEKKTIEETPAEVKVEEKKEEIKEPAKEEVKAEPKVKKVPAKKKEEPKVNDEVERLSKLNDELDDILKDEL